MMVAVATTDDLEKTVSQKGNKFTRNSGNAYMYVHMRFESALLIALYPSLYVCTCIEHTYIIHAYIHTYFIQCIMHNNSCTYIHIILCLCFHDSIVLIGYVNTRQRFTVFGSSSTIHLHEAASSLKQPASLAYSSTNPATQTLQSTSVRLYCIRHHLCCSQPL